MFHVSGLLLDCYFSCFRMVIRLLYFMFQDGYFIVIFHVSGWLLDCYTSCFRMVILLLYFMFQDGY